ncbi:hypothetical protein K435DRAFT_860429 [Dendrothele bispora CBS 962.96]|uniref:Uncharacterized protein n=1 Tax=Dendrothele bispora (strain CBS 962.96) TaxID=1314807 RepID=A0A4S8LYJ3_DENBC|nr:hypothetical protein K435DRAFT_860429 [Dendrothele bispora CBS 962.96]
MSISISIPFCADHPTSTTPRHLHHQPGTGLSLSSESEASSRRRRLHSTFGGSSPHENRLKDRLELEKQYSKQIDELLRENKSQKVSITRLTAANTELFKRLESVENEKKDLISEINRALRNSPTNSSPSYSPLSSLPLCPPPPPPPPSLPFPPPSSLPASSPNPSSSPPATSSSTLSLSPTSTIFFRVSPQALLLEPKPSYTS